MSHPCNCYSCSEWNQGECFGGGCKRNPAPEREDETSDENENENTQEN